MKYFKIALIIAFVFGIFTQAAYGQFFVNKNIRPRSHRKIEMNNHSKSIDERREVVNNRWAEKRNALMEEFQSKSLKKNDKRSVNAIPAGERAALIALYNITNGDNWFDNTGWKDGILEADGFGPFGSEDTWEGVYIDAGVVKGIEFWDNNLDGTLPAQIGDLTNLEYLLIAGNPITGNIPVEISNLVNLAGLCLASNLLNGNIPPELGNLTSLQYLFLSDNSITGSIPEELGDLHSLIELDLTYNSLTGPIPAGMVEPGDLPNIEYLCFGFNSLTGSIPPGLGNLINLEYLDLWSNNLSGNIPTQLGGLINLIYLCLWENDLTGSIPVELGNLTNIEYFDLASNHLVGAIPPQLENLSTVYEIYLEENKLSGNIPTQLSNLSNLEYFYIAYNTLAGEIPSALINLSNLYDIYLDYNALYTNNAALEVFLEPLAGDWQSKQTVAPTNVSAKRVNLTDVKVSWSPVSYNDDPGGYNVYYSTLSNGPYSYFGITPNKLTNNIIVNGLPAGDVYYFVVETQTEVDNYNLNIVRSVYSSEVFTSDPPMAAVNTGVDINQGESVTISKNMLRYIDPDGLTTYNSYTLIDPPVHGTLLKNGVTLTALNTFMQEDINNSKIVYAHNGSSSAGDNFSFEVVDNANATSSPDIFEIRVAIMNNPPEFIGLPTSLSFICGDCAIVDICGCTTDEETPDSGLLFEFNSSNNSLITEFDNTTGELTITAVDGFSGDVELTVRVTDPEGAFCEEVITVTIEASVTSIDDIISGTPKEFTFNQNYPNPFNPSTTIRYGLPEASNVKLVVYNMLGQEVAVLVDGEQRQGFYDVRWNAFDQPSGIYFCVINVTGDNSFREVMKMLLIK